MRKLGLTAAIFGAMLLAAPSSTAGGTAPYIRDVHHGNSVGSFACGGFDCVGGGVLWNVDLTGAAPNTQVVVTLAFRYSTTKGDDAVVGVTIGDQHREALLRAAPLGDSAVVRFVFRPDSVPTQLSTVINAGPNASGPMNLTTSAPLLTLEAAP